MTDETKTVDMLPVSTLPDWRRRWLILAGWTAAFVLFGMLAPLEVPEWLRLPALYVTAVVGAGATGVVLYAFTRTNRNWVDLGLGLAVFVLLIRGVNSATVMAAIPAVAARLAEILPVSAPVAGAVVNLVTIYATNCFLVGSALCAGELVGKGLRAPSYLVLAAVVGAIADTFSVSTGPTAKLASSETVLRQMAVHWPGIGTGGALPIVGLGDFLFLSIFLLGAHKFSLGVRRNLAALLLAFAVGIACTMLADMAFNLHGLPALPFMCAAFLAVNWKKLKVTREELRTVVLMSLAVSVLLAVVAVVKAFLAGR